jgi:DNA-directed RNA polymerase subunit D
MELKILKKNDNKITFKISKINPAIANSFRRYITAYLPTMAIDEVEIKKNGSAFFDEMLALRIGLVPLKTNAKGYKLWEGSQSERPKTAQYELKFTLKSKGPCTVYSSDLKSSDPKIIPAFDKIPIMKLLEGQDIELIGTARLGQGREHAKFNAGFAFYRGIPKLVTKKESNISAVIEKLSDVITKKGNSLEIKDYTKWNEAHEEICETNDIDIISSKEDFIFTIESWGQMSPKDMVTGAIEIFDQKLSEFEGYVKKLK